MTMEKLPASLEVMRRIFDAGPWSPEQILAICDAISTAIAEEREACAKYVEDWHARGNHDSWEWCDCDLIAAAIRQRSESPKEEPAA